MNIVDGVNGSKEKISSFGMTHTYLNNVLHSFDDEPSRASHDKKLNYWHENGVLHREDGKPAMIIELKNEYVVGFYENGIHSENLNSLFLKFLFNELSYFSPFEDIIIDFTDYSLS